MATPTDELVAIMRQRLLRETGDVLNLERSRVVPEVNRHVLAAPAVSAVEPPVPTITGTPTAATAPTLPASTDAARDGRHQAALDLSFSVDFTAKAAAKGAADADRTLLVCKVEQYACGYLSFARSWDAAKGAVQSQSLQVAAATAVATDAAAAAGGATAAAAGPTPTKSFRVVRAGAAGAPAYTWAPSQVDLAAYGLATGNCFVVSTLREAGASSASKPATGDVKGRVNVSYQVTGLEAETGYAFQVVPGVLTIKAGAAPVVKAPAAAPSTSTTTAGDGATAVAAAATPAAAPAASFTLVWGAPSATSATLTTLSAAEQVKRDVAAAEALKALQEATNAKMQADLMAIASSGGSYGASVFAARVGAYESRIAKATPTKGASPAASTAAAAAHGSGGRVPRPSAAAATAATGTGPSKGRVHIDRKELEGTMARIAALEGALQASQAAAAAAHAALAAANAAAQAAAEKAAAAGATADAGAAAEAARVEADFAAQRSAQADEALASQTEDVAALRETVTQVLAEAAASGPAAPAATAGDGAATAAPAAAATAATGAAAAAGGAAADTSSSAASGGGFFSYIGSFVGFS